MPSLPTLPEGFLDLLAKGVAGIASDAAARIQQQLSHHHFREEGEAWLSQGLPHIVDERCPFCAAPLEGNSLIDVYRGYFSKSYAAHKAAIAEMGAALNQGLSSTTALRVEQSFGQVAIDAEFWNAYCDHGYVPSGAAGRISGEVQALFDAAKAMLATKAAAPLDSVEIIDGLHRGAGHLVGDDHYIGGRGGDVRRGQPPHPGGEGRQRRGG